MSDRRWVQVTVALPGQPQWTYMANEPAPNGWPLEHDSWLFLVQQTLEEALRAVARDREKAAVA